MKLSNIYIIILLSVLPLQALAQSSFSGERLEEACKAYVSNQMEGDIEVDVLNDIRDYKFKNTNVEARFSKESDTFTGYSKVGIEFIHENDRIEKLIVPVKVKIFDLVPVTNRNLTKGEEIKKTDLTMERMDISNLRADEIKNKENITGSVVSNFIPKGKLISSRNIQNTKIVRRGDHVELIVISGGVRIRSKATVLQDAAPGETVRLKRDGRGSLLHGLVAKDGTVIISSSIVKGSTTISRTK